jgi:hypothetical protein
MNRLVKLANRGLLFSCLLLPGAALLRAAETAPQTIQVKIGSILASNRGDDFDARLAPLEKQLKVMKYRSYRLLKEESRTVERQGSTTFEIPGGRSLIIVPQEADKKQIALKVRLQQGGKPLLDTSVRLNNGGNFLLGGPPHEGGALVLSISATVR